MKKQIVIFPLFLWFITQWIFVLPYSHMTKWIHMFFCYFIKYESILNTYFNSSINSIWRLAQYSQCNTLYTLPVLQTLKEQEQGQGTEQLWVLKAIMNYNKKFSHLNILFKKPFPVLCILLLLLIGQHMQGENEWNCQVLLLKNYLPEC